MEGEKIKVANSFFERGATQESALIKLCKSNQLPTKVSYWLSRILKELTPLNKLYLEEKQKLIEKWCDRDEEGKIILQNDMIFFKEHMKEFNLDITELVSIESELPFNKIEIPLDKIPEGLINSYDYGELDDFVVFQE